MTQIRSAQATLSELEGGQIMNQLAQAFHDAADAVKVYNKPAKITLTIEVAPFKGLGQNLMEHPIGMTAEVVCKLPKPETPATLFFVDEQGPSRNPTTRQSTLTGIGSVDPQTGEIKQHA